MQRSQLPSVITYLLRFLKRCIKRANNVEQETVANTLIWRIGCDNCLTVTSHEEMTKYTHEIESGVEYNVPEIVIVFIFSDCQGDDLSKLLRALINNATFSTLTINISNCVSVENATCISNLLDQNVNPLGRLHHLHFRGNWMTNENIFEILKGLKNNNSLVGLEIYFSKIGESGAKYLGNAIATNHSLEYLILWPVKIGNAGAESIAEGIIQRQYPSKNNIARHFSTQPCKEFELELCYDYKIGVMGAKAFASLLHKQHSALSPLVTLTKLNLSVCSLGDEGAVAIAESLKSYNTDIGLKKLDLSENRIGNTGTIAFANALKQNCALTDLYLHGNEIGLDGGIALCQTLEKYNDTLSCLFFKKNPCSDLMWKNGETIFCYLNNEERNRDENFAAENKQRLKATSIFNFITSDGPCDMG